MENKVKHIVRVHRPELTPEERERRMERIKEAAINLLLSAERAHKPGTLNEN